MIPCDQLQVVAIQTFARRQKMASSTIFSSILAVVLAVAVYYYIKNKNQTDFMERILQGLLREERNVNVSKHLRVAVGFGSCMDLIVDAVPLLEKLGIQPPGIPSHHEMIGDEKGLAEAFAFFMKEGAASE